MENCVTEINAFLAGWADKPDRQHSKGKDGDPNIYLPKRLRGSFHRKYIILGVLSSTVGEGWEATGNYSRENAKLTATMHKRLWLGKLKPMLKVPFWGPDVAGSMNTDAKCLVKGIGWTHFFFNNGEKLTYSPNAQAFGSIDIA